MRFLVAGAGTVGLYIGGVWFGTEIMAWNPRIVNIVFYCLATGISFLLAYFWIFQSTARPGSAILRYTALQLGGVVLNQLWVEGGLRFTDIYPWIIAATYFAVWPFISFFAQRKLVFK